LKAVRQNKPPIHAHRAVDLDSLARIEETGKTVDIPAPPDPGKDLWHSPVVIGLAVTAGLSVVVNLVLMVLILAGK
jgi:hypothetical protein